MQECLSVRVSRIAECMCHFEDEQQPITAQTQRRQRLDRCNRCKSSLPRKVEGEEVAYWSTRTLIHSHVRSTAQSLGQSKCGKMRVIVANRQAADVRRMSDDAMLFYLAASRKYWFRLPSLYSPRAAASHACPDATMMTATVALHIVSVAALYEQKSVLSRPTLCVEERHSVCARSPGIQHKNNISD